MARFRVFDGEVWHPADLRFQVGMDGGWEFVPAVWVMSPPTSFHADTPGTEPRTYDGLGVRRTVFVEPEPGYYDLSRYGTALYSSSNPPSYYGDEAATYGTARYVSHPPDVPLESEPPPVPGEREEGQ